MESKGFFHRLIPRITLLLILIRDYRTKEMMTAMGKNCKDIDEIWYSFSRVLSEKAVAQWKEEYKKEFQGDILPVITAADRLRKDFMEAKEKEKRIFFISDSSGLCQIAESCEIPFLAYMDSQWKDADFSSVIYGTESLSVITQEFVGQICKRFYHEPWEILQTERCLVRETTQDDTDALYEIYKEPSITLYTEKLYEDKEQEKDYICQYIKNVYEFYGFGIWTIIFRETGELIGRAGLTYREGYSTPEIGYVIALPFQKKGIATEVCSAILEYGFEILGFQEIRALFEPENAASERLCQKLGFQKESLQLVDGIIMQQYVKKRKS